MDDVQALISLYIIYRTFVVRLLQIEHRCISIVT